MRWLPDEALTTLIVALLLSTPLLDPRVTMALALGALLLLLGGQGRRSARG